MPRASSFALTAALLVAATASDARAQRTDQLRRELRGVGVDERLGARVPLDRELVDEHGRHVRPRSYLRPGRPALLSLNYTSCPMLCSVQLAGLAVAIRELGRDAAPFEIVTVSIDPEEQLLQLRRAQLLYVGQAGGRRELAERWHFLAGDEASIHAIADAVGFRYRYDRATREFRHAATLVVLTPDGRVSSYLHGVSYPPDRLRPALRRAARGEIIDTTEQQSIGGYLLSCFVYDPTSGAPTALLVMRIGGLAVAVFLLGFIGYWLVRERRARRTCSPDPSSSS